MGTRADFYVGAGREAEWLGSIAHDGFLIDTGCADDREILAVRNANDEASFRQAVAALLDGRDDATKPELGWPWPWDDSNTTDYAYAYADGSLRVWRFGREKALGEDEDKTEGPSPFPNMADRRNMTLGARSGLLIFRA